MVTQPMPWQALVSDYSAELVKVASGLLSIGELPIASLVFVDKEIVGRTPVVRRSSRLDHGEVTALRSVAAHQRWRPSVLFTTVEPCEMCYSAARASGVSLIIYWLRAGGDGIAANLASGEAGGPELHQVQHPAVMIDLMREHATRSGVASAYSQQVLQSNEA